MGKHSGASEPKKSKLEILTPTEDEHTTADVLYDAFKVDTAYGDYEGYNDKEKPS